MALLVEDLMMTQAGIPWEAIQTMTWAERQASVVVAREMMERRQATMKSSGG